MKIKKVDDKPMVIHTKKRPKLHLRKKKDIRYQSNVDFKGETKKSVRWKEDSNSSIKVKDRQLKNFAYSSAKAAARQVEGGEEIADSMDVMLTASLPVTIASEKAAKQYRKKKAKEKAERKEKRRKNRIQSEMEYSETSIHMRRNAIKKKDNKSKDGDKKDCKDKEKSGGNSRGLNFVKDRMITSFLDKLSVEQEDGQGGLIENTKQNAKAAMILLAQYIATALAPVMGIIFLVVAVVGAIVVSILAVIYNSPLALFFPSPDTGTESPRTVLCEYYKEFNEEVIRLENGGATITYQNNENGVPVSNFNDTLMVYMVKYGTGQCGLVMDEQGKKNLKEVFDEMNYMNSEENTMEIDAGESLGEVVATAYCPCSICCGPYANGITASGKKARARHTIAVDAYNPIVPMGTKVIIEGVTYTVEDTGNLNVHNTDFDIFYATHEACGEWGKRTVEAFLAEGNENRVTVTVQGTMVHNLTYQDYIALNKLSEDQNTLLTDMMNEDLWDSYYDVAAGSAVADLAMTKIGCHYDQDRRYEEGYYDCSSLVQRLYKEVGIELPATAAPQGEYCYKNAMLVNKKDLKPGDLIFYSYEENGEFRNISHVAIYVGDGKMVHAANESRGVVIDPLRTESVVFYARPY